MSFYGYDPGRYREDFSWVQDVANTIGTTVGGVVATQEALRDNKMKANQLRTMVADGYVKKFEEIGDSSEVATRRVGAVMEEIPPEVAKDPRMVLEWVATKDKQLSEMFEGVKSRQRSGAISEAFQEESTVMGRDLETQRGIEQRFGRPVEQPTREKLLSGVAGRLAGTGMADVTQEELAARPEAGEFPTQKEQVAQQREQRLSQQEQRVAGVRGQQQQMSVRKEERAEQESLAKMRKYAAEIKNMDRKAKLAEREATAELLRDYVEDKNDEYFTEALSDLAAEIAENEELAKKYTAGWGVGGMKFGKDLAKAARHQAIVDMAKEREPRLKKEYERWLKAKDQLDEMAVGEDSTGASPTGANFDENEEQMIQKIVASGKYTREQAEEYIRRRRGSGSN